MRFVAVGLGLLLASGAVRAAERELRPPAAELEVELEPDDGAAKVRVYWSCYARDLGAAARNWVQARAAVLDCTTDAAARDEKAVQSALEAAAGGRVLGDPGRGQVREVDASPGREKLIKANFCYSAAAVEQITQWSRRQLAARCSEAQEGE